MKKINNLHRTSLIKVCSEKTFKELKVLILLLLLSVFNAFGVNAFPGSTDGNFDSKTDPSSIMQQVRITGTVTDENGSPFPGVSIKIEGTTLGTISDINGKFSLEKPNDNVVLIFSFVGYITQKISGAGQTSIEVSMKAELKPLEEVVVTGYSSQRKKDITGSVAVVDVQSIKSTLSRSVQQALQGMASGVDITQSGIPGAAPKIYIRGVTSFGNTDPLVIVDGIQQSLNNISTNDIESIQVLKDAGAASIYGVRGSNGVILVTTKKGKTGAPVVTYEGSYGEQFPLPGDPWGILNSQDYMKVYLSAFPGNPRFANGMPDYMYRGPLGAGVAMEGDPAIAASNYYYASPNRGQNYIIQKVNKDREDWFHDLFKRAPTTDHNITASGGTEKSKYLFSLGYLNQQGTLVKTSLKRYSARINTEYTLGKHITGW